MPRKLSLIRFSYCKSLCFPSVFGQNRRQLRCYECENCDSVEDNYPLRQCYGPGPEPTLQTTPTPSKLRLEYLITKEKLHSFSSQYRWHPQPQQPQCRQMSYNQIPTSRYYQTLNLRTASWLPDKASILCASQFDDTVSLTVTDNSGIFSEL